MLLQILSLDPFAKTNISENLHITPFAKISLCEITKKITGENYPRYDSQNCALSKPDDYVKARSIASI